jgi:hypothetical protein
MDPGCPSPILGPRLRVNLDKRKVPLWGIGLIGVLDPLGRVLNSSVEGGVP